MGIKRYKPTSPGRRGASGSDYSELTRRSPEKKLTSAKKSTGGRNNYGRITARYRGAGNKNRYRIVDFRRNKDGVPAKVAHIEYDPNRNCRIALLHYLDGEKRYIICPDKLKVGDMVSSGEKADIKPGCALQIRNIPTGTIIHAVELRPGGGAKIARSAGTSVQLLSKEGKYANLRMPSGEVRMVETACRASIGEVGNAEWDQINWGKAGRTRYKGRRGHTRGVVMNPVDHPLGGGEGKTSGGRHPVSPWGKPEGRTRKPKPSDKLIRQRRKK